MRERAQKALWLTLAVLVGAAMVVAYWRWIYQAPAGFSFTRDGVAYQLLEPRTLGLVLVTPLLLYAVGRSLADLPWQQRAVALLLRLAFVALLALSLARLVHTAKTHKVAVVFVVDVSESVSDEALEDARTSLSRALEAKGTDDLVRLVTFARRPELRELAADGGAARIPPTSELRMATGASGRESPGAATNVQAALQLAYGLFPAGYLKRIVLITDGLETDGDLLAEANRARELGIRLFTEPYRRPMPGEVAVRTLRLPDKVLMGQAFDVVADIWSSREASARARLYQGEALNGLEGVRQLTLKPGDNEVTFKSIVRVGGEVTYRLELDGIPEDKFKENNAFTSTLDVPGRAQVLYVEGQPQRANYLMSALSAQQFDVDVRPAGAFPGSLKELERFDFVVLSDVPREAVSIGSQELIEQYVRDLGGGFLFAGGEAGYGLGGWAHTTMERMLPVRMDVERRKDMPSVAMVLIIDRSGSMTGIPLEMAKAACRATVGTLEGDDLIEVIAFDSEPIQYVKFQAARYRARIENEIARILPGGGTEIFPALDMGYRDISTVQARKKHAILLTDGRSPTQGLRDLVQAMISEAITVTTVGLGDQTDQELLRGLADLGGGRFHYVPDPNSLPRIFTRETELVARQAAVEEWFPVRQVAPAAFLKGIAVNTAPLLHGYVATQLKAAPAQSVLESDRGEPILARWRVGLGQALAWTSDVKNLWAVDWLKWSGWSQFWGQLVREHMRQKHRRELDMRTEIIGNRVRAFVDAFTVDERFENGIVSTLSISGPAPRGKRRDVPMRQTAPGRYEASFDLEEYGSFLLKAEHAKEDPTTNELRQHAVSYGQVSNPYPREYASFEPDIERLTRAALTGGGAFRAPPRALFDPEGETIEYREPLWNRFLLGALAVFLLDLLVRRVRIFDRKFVPRRPRRAR